MWFRRRRLTPKAEPQSPDVPQPEAASQAPSKTASESGSELAPTESFVAGAATVSVLKFVFKWVERYERQLSGAGMVGGFAFDNYNFRRLDMPNTQLVFVGYLSLAAISILILHAMAERAASGRKMPRWHGVLPMVAQFALGALWSAFLVFYSRGAVLAASWPFLLVLIAIFVANEVFKKYHSRLIFTAILFFFALFSYAIVTTPILTRSVGTFTFILSGIVALFLFALFLKLVKRFGPGQWQGARWWVVLGAGAVYLALNAFYFFDVLPPLPLALADGGVYRFVVKQGDAYHAVEEPQTWLTVFGASPVMHVEPGASLYVYSAVFAPIRMSTNIMHRWEHYDAARHKWRTVSRVIFAINGGRDGGYRAYSLSRHVEPGGWRVDVDTADGRIIGRVRFSVVDGPAPYADEKRTLK
ncbi:MAG: DUF2914 domain-containing protein [Rhizomicrobium sp.]